MKKLVIGLLFCAAGILSMMLPIQADPGAIVSATNIVTAFSAWIGGPLSALVTVIGIVGYRIYLGGIGMSSGVLATLTAAVIGIGYHYIHYFMNAEWTRQREMVIDDVTGLPHSEFFKLQIQRKINARIPFYLTVLNIDGFETISALNNTKIRNELLRQVAQRMTQRLPLSGSACRLKGELFLICITNPLSKNLTSPEPDYWQEMQTLLSAPYLIDHKLCHVTISTGMTTCMGEDISLDQVLLRANTALQHAKDSGVNQTVQYREKLAEQIRHRMLIEVYLRTALEDGQLSLSYQPQYELQSGKLRGFEALLRWTHTELGSISPSDFMPIAEETRLIIPIGDWVLRQACEMLQRVAPAPSTITISVNISGLQLLAEDFPDQVMEMISETGIDADRLEIELTESTLMSSLDITERRLKKLQDLGVQLALDNFGTGFSSMNYLRNLPFHAIKMDKSFIQDIGHTPEQEVTESMIQIIKQLRYDIVAEGLETYEQLVFLKKCKCDFAQGNLFSQPLPEAQLHSLVQSVKVV